MDFQSIALPA